jgi:hypothetical protein
MLPRPVPRRLPGDLKPQQRRDSTDKETSYATHGKDEVKGSSPFVGSFLYRKLTSSSVHFCPRLSSSVHRGGQRIISTGVKNDALPRDRALPDSQHGKQEVSGSSPDVGLSFLLSRAASGPHALGHVRRSARYPHRLARQSRPALSSIAMSVGRPPRDHPVLRLALPATAILAPRPRTPRSPTPRITYRQANPTRRATAGGHESRPHLTMRKRQPAEDQPPRRPCGTLGGVGSDGCFAVGAAVITVSLRDRLHSIQANSPSPRNPGGSPNSRVEDRPGVSGADALPARHGMPATQASEDFGFHKSANRAHPPFLSHLI